MPTFSVVSLGCPKNLVDTERMVGQLCAAGWDFSQRATKVDLVLVNTCGFLGSAQDEAKDILRELINHKKKRRLRFIAITGCMLERLDTAKLTKEFPQVDAWVGVASEHQIASILNRYFIAANTATNTVATSPTPPKPVQNSPQIVTSIRLSDTEGGSPERSRACYFPDPNTDTNIPQNVGGSQNSARTLGANAPKILLTEPHVAYLKIADGCNRRCAYCAIPSIRGPFVSMKREMVLDEARRLRDDGVQELILIAQETTRWGSDLYGQPELASLLESLQSLGGFQWIRLMYTYPQFFSKEFVSLLGTTVNGTTILPYLDLPLQHSNTELLRKMNRIVSREETEDLLAMLRKTVPELVLRTTFIVGFPGETDAMFAELLEFVEKWQFERAGVFLYSPESGTPAATFPHPVSEVTKQWRYRTLYKRLNDISTRWASRQVGRKLPVMIDRQAVDEKGHPIPLLYIGRTFADSPENDPCVYVTTETPLMKTSSPTSPILPCEIVAASGLDLAAVPVVG